jgi:hypothetical protein
VKHLGYLVLFLALALQQIVIYNLRKDLCLLIYAVEREQKENHQEDRPEFIDNCALPAVLDPPHVDIGWQPPFREQ